MQIYYLLILEVRSLKNQRVSRTVLLLKALGENLFNVSSSFQQLPTFLGPWLLLPPSKPKTE